MILKLCSYNIKISHKNASKINQLSNYW